MDMRNFKHMFCKSDSCNFNVYENRNGCYAFPDREKAMINLSNTIGPASEGGR